MNTSSSAKTAKAWIVAYWICTVLVAASFLSGGIAHLMHSPEAVTGMTRLGYPPYFMTILGFWKVLGAIAIVIPGFALIKEWAYAGIMFDLTGAAFSHFSAGDSDATMSNTGHVIAPLVIAALLVVSWKLRPPSRRLKA